MGNKISSRCWPFALWWKTEIFGISWTGKQKNQKWFNWNLQQYDWCIQYSKRNIFEHDNSGLRGHEHKLFNKRFRLDIRKFSLSNRVTDAWNSLPALCVNSATINCFKTHVSVALEPETETWLLTIVGYYMAQACAHLCHQRRHLLMLVAMMNLANDRSMGPCLRLVADQLQLVSNSHVELESEVQTVCKEIQH